MKKSFAPDKPFNNLPLLPPKADLETRAVLKQLIKTNQILAELKGYSDLLPNKAIVINSIILQEAKDSSEIENIVTTHDDLYKAMASDQKSVDPAVKEVLNYRNALYKGLSLVKQNNILTTNTIVAIQEALEQNKAGIRKLPGTKPVNDSTGQIMFTPPDNEKTIRDLLKNLEDYINTQKENIHPLIKLAVIHYQFESIHPFYDGNGRTGRIINVLYLVLKDLLNEPFLYLSRYIIQHKSDYYRLLRKVTSENTWEEWILFMLEAVEKTATHTLSLSKKIVNLMDNARKIIQNQKPKIYTRELADTLFTNVYIRIGHIVDNKIASRNIASRYLKELEEIGILKYEKTGRQNFYINTRLYDLIKNFDMH
ncbi:MAG: Fic family protein [Desulfobacterales bacterium]|nr:Fic family protein [Desulfobacterales bacterium]